MAIVDRVGSALEHGPGRVVLSSLDALFDWARSHSQWVMPMGTACCAMEMIASFPFTKFDSDRHGVIPQADPRHADVMVVAGTITRKMQPAVIRLYEQMPDPKWVIAMGNCTVSGGIFYYDTYSVVRGVDEFLPVDVYIAGCPPRPEAVQDALMQLREKIRQESIGPNTRHVRKLTLPGPGESRASVEPSEPGEVG